MLVSCFMVAIIGLILEYYFVHLPMVANYENAFSGLQKSLNSRNKHNK